MRVLDSKREQDQPVIAEAPVMADFLSGASAEHFAAVRAGLDSLDAAYEISPRLVRGLDYYTRTAFEFVADALDTAQNAVGGGGRYDGLGGGTGRVPDAGHRLRPGRGPHPAGLRRRGSAFTEDRLTRSRCSWWTRPAARVPSCCVTSSGGAGLGVDRAFDSRSMKAQMKRADRSGAAVAVIVGT